MLRRFFGGSNDSTDYKAFEDEKNVKPGSAAAVNNVAGAKDRLASAAPGPSFPFSGKKPEPKPATQAKKSEETPLLGPK